MTSDELVRRIAKFEVPKGPTYATTETLRWCIDRAKEVVREQHADIQIVGRVCSCDVCLAVE